ncbi:hypothetical protein BO78DRAFT_293494, partial [Aspergillus sclerotiicarbonarius CBS 121057]
SMASNSFNYSQSPELSSSSGQDDSIHSDCQHLHQAAQLESLPAEIRIEILSILELESLASLVRASPVYHQQYLLGRKHLLFQYLEATLGDIFVEACAVYTSGSKGFSEARNKDNVPQFLSSLGERRFLSHSSLKDELTLDDVVNMVTFHRLVIQPLVRHYADWALKNLAKELESANKKSSKPLSIVEEARIMRALYRVQLCCNLFSLGPHQIDPSSLSPRLEFEPTDTLEMLEGLFEPWELEEISCINAFAENKCIEVLEDICWELNSPWGRTFNFRRGKWALNADSLTSRFEDTPDVFFLMRGVVGQGLELLHTICFKIKSRSRLVSTVERSVKPAKTSFLGGNNYGVFSYESQQDRRKRAPSERDEAQQRRDPLPFQGDHVSGVHPPLAWTLLWHGTYSNMLGYFIGDAITNWGYIMWDAARMEHTGAKDVLARQW